MSRIVSAIAQPYCLPLCQPWQTASGVITERYGWLIKITTADGFIGWGDCAPLPIAGTETEAAATAALPVLLPQLVGQTVLHLLTMKCYSSLPSVNFGIETALVDIAAQTNGVPVAQWLCPTAKHLVPLNAAVGIADTGLMRRAQIAVAAGYKVLKIKLGLQPWLNELRYLQSLTGELPSEIKLRLDVNQAWNHSEAVIRLMQLVELPIESVEEPLAKTDFALLAKLQIDLPFVLALDESLASIPIASWLDNYPVQRLILKPSVIGGLRSTLSLAQRAQERGLEWVITSTLESGVGIRAAAQVAAALGTTWAQGLATSSWFVKDVIADLPIERGILVLNSAPGLGISANNWSS